LSVASLAVKVSAWSWQARAALRGGLAVASLLLAGPASAWVYPEHRDIALLGVQTLDARRGAQFQALWTEARAGHEQRLCEQAADAGQGLAPQCVDWAAMPAIGGDHSCSSRDMLEAVLRSDWILGVADVAAQLKEDLARVPVTPTAEQIERGGSASAIQYPDFARRIQGGKMRAERQNALRVADLRLQRADPAYATRAGANNAHFLHARPTTAIDPHEYAHLTIGPGAALNAVGVYSFFHLSALQKALRLANEKLPPETRSELVRTMLADEAFALHFLQDTFAAGHVSGTWGDTSQRKGTHDFYNASGLEVRTWDHTDGAFVLMGDAHMRPEDAKVAARAVRTSLEQVVDVANGKSVPGMRWQPRLSAEPEAFDVCKSATFPERPSDQQITREVTPVLAQTLLATPVPSLGPGLGAMPRFRSELGTFVGLAGSLEVRGLNGGFAPGQNDRGVVYGLDLGFRIGMGLEGVIGDSGDGLVFAQIGLHSDAASTNRIVDSDSTSFGGGLLAAIPSRTGLSTRVRMPFYLVPGDLLFTAPLYFLSPETYSRMAVTASNGGLLGWQVGWSTAIGRFQFVLGRELGITFYGITGTDSLFSPGPPVQIVDYKSTYYDLPILEYRPFRSFSTNQSSSVLFQLFGGIDVPYGDSVAAPAGSLAPPLKNVYSLGLRMVFDWRYYY
jgi:hypothetical protein